MDTPKEHEIGAGEPLTSRRVGIWRYANVLFGVLLLAALGVIIHNIDAERRFAALLSHAAPGWLLVALGYQVGTYACAAGIWVRVLRPAGVPLRVRALIPLGLAKLFVDQIVPTAGVGGTLLVVHGLIRRGVSQGLATAALLMDLLSFYAAHGLAIVLALVILWTSHYLHPAVLILATLFSAVATVVPLTIVWVTRRGRRAGPPWMCHLPGSTRLFEALAAVPADVVRDPARLLQTTLLQCAIVALDAATLDATLRAVGYPARPAAVFASFTMASVVATLSLIPGGLGVFEGVSVALLRLLDVPIEAGLAATLLLRAATFWLPMVPGLWIVRREHP